MEGVSAHGGGRGVGTWVILKVPSNPNHFRILWYQTEVVKWLVLVTEMYCKIMNELKKRPGLYVHFAFCCDHL